MNIEGTPYPNNKELAGKCSCGKQKNALVTVEKIDYEMFYWDRLKIVCVGQYKFGNIDSEYVKSSIISTMLYDYGVVCFFVDDVLDELMCLPCKILRFGICGMPTRVEVFSPFVKKYRRILDVGDGDKFHVCFDTETMLSPKMFFVPWITEMAEISVTMRVNALALRAPITAVSTIGQKLSMENILQQYLDGKYIIELKDNKVKDRTGGIIDDDLSKRIKTLDLSSPYHLDKLNSQRDAIWNKIMETLGFKVNTAPFKKERAITGEVEGNAEETVAFYAARRNPRMDAVKWMNENGYPNVELIEVTKVEDLFKESNTSGKRLVGQGGDDDVTNE